MIQNSSFMDNDIKKWLKDIQICIFNIETYIGNKKEFAEYRNQVHEFTNTLFNAYVSCYIKKEGPLNQYSGQVKTHMFNIHKIFLTTLKEQGLYVTMSVVVSYVNGLHPSQLMYALNFDKHVNK